MLAPPVVSPLPASVPSSVGSQRSTTTHFVATARFPAISPAANPGFVAEDIPVSVVGVVASLLGTFALDNFQDGGAVVLVDVAIAIVGNAERCWADVGPVSGGKEHRVALEGPGTVSAVRTDDCSALLGPIDCRNGFEAARGPVVLWDHYLQGALVIQVDLAVSPDTRSVMEDLALPTE